MNGRRKTYSVLLFLLYAVFFASGNFFYHSHELNGVRIVHSHLWSGAHNHTAAQFSFIEAVGTSAFRNAESADIPSFLAVFCKEIFTVCESLGKSVCILGPNTLRAPPYRIL